MVSSTGVQSQMVRPVDPCDILMESAGRFVGALGKKKHHGRSCPHAREPVEGQQGAAPAGYVPDGGTR